MEYDYFTINYFPIIGIAFLTIFLWRNSFLDNHIRKSFYILSALTLFELLTYNIEMICTSVYTNKYILTFITAVGYSVKPLILYFLMLLIIRDESLIRVKLPLFVPFAVNVLTSFSAFFVPAVFYYDNEGVFHRGIFGWTTNIVMVIYIMTIIMVSFSDSTKKHKFERTVCMEISLILIIGILAESFFGSYAVFRYTIVLSLIFYYMFFQSETYRGEIVEKHMEKVHMSERFTLQMVTALAQTVDAKDSYTKGHSQRVADYSREISKRINKDEEFQRRIYYMGLLHDIGKIGIPDDIINKTGELTDEEFDIIKSHTKIGAEILKNITEMPNLYFGARWHHERYDGKGYPDNLKGDEIPLEARIIAVADCYDAMSSKRSYRDILPQIIVREEMEKAKRTQLDPYLVNIMLEMIDADSMYFMRER